MNEKNIIMQNAYFVAKQRTWKEQQANFGELPLRQFGNNKMLFLLPIEI
jgi:hypothetical protein